MRHVIWFMAAGLLILTACALSTPTPNEATTPTVVPTVITDRPTATLPDTATPEVTSTPTTIPSTKASASGQVQATKKPAAPDVQRVGQEPSYPYGLQSGTPAVLQNFLNTDSCDYLGVGGQVFKLNGDAVTGLVVEITGTLNGKNVLYLGLTGNAQNLGPGGYELKIGAQPVDSSGTLKIQVFNLNGVPQTPLIPINTYADCNKNFVLVNFSQRFPIKSMFWLPFIGK
ncbi:MAG: hypothetical protein P8Z00_21255 [Anaerolineales bacterium]|jgi:hypothetical protein